MKKISAELEGGEIQKPNGKTPHLLTGENTDETTGIFLRKRFVHSTGVKGCFLHSAAVYKYLYTCVFLKQF